ncbi:MAG: hormogonium polysaccharide biosynthesis protein HpsA [Rhizonema sp. PD38]|nr:hormogonium polysaccharide biosynthesis protein HpsA [Rhizonema sp. PD38]
MTIKKQLILLLRTFLITKRRRVGVNAGFVLPTVAMVILVVILLTTAILFRSFDRSKNASNVRVNEAVLNATTPAIERARAKLNDLFAPGKLTLGTPTDLTIEGAFTKDLDKYTFGDETKLKLSYSSNPELTTAWIYPVDTDNNGKFDSYTLYGIYYKNPPISNGKYTRARNPLEARTLPMLNGSLNGECADTLGTSATLVSNGSWLSFGGKLIKSFFVYIANVPITTQPTDQNHYELYKSNKGFSALEYQQDRVQLSVVNNAVVYDDDIELTPGTDFRLNGRILTNSNFLTGGLTGVYLYQVSSRASCFYEEDNARIIIGGNIANGDFTGKTSNSFTKVDLFSAPPALPAAPGTPTQVDLNGNNSTKNTSDNIAYNSLAYVQRVNRLVDAQIANNATSDPQEVKDGITSKKKQLNLPSYTSDQDEQIRRTQLELYFKKRTRRVPYQEIKFNSDALGDYKVSGNKASQVLQGSGDNLRPPDTWIYPTDPSDGISGNTYTNLTLNVDSNKLLYPGAIEPTQQQNNLQGQEKVLGDRALIGNNLPEMWWNNGNFVGPALQDTQPLTGIMWNDATDVTKPSTVTRTRHTRVEQLADLGDTSRDGDWEVAAATVPANPQEPVGGLRVITGAGIYLPSGYTTTGSIDDSNFAKASAATQEIWSDMMPVASRNAANNNSTVDKDIMLPNPTYTPYLRMRATAVYHYKTNNYDGNNPIPIACVSSYYDPTNSDRASSSNNGRVYGVPNKTEDNYQAVLNYQTQLKYLNGRLVNEPLKNALAKAAVSRTRADKSAIDAALCALQILDGSITSDPSIVPDNAIKETAFLDARQIKAIHNDVQKDANNNIIPGIETFTNADGNGKVSAKIPAAADYDLPIIQRQPLEIRATMLDIGALRGKTIGDTSNNTPQEYLLPNSGLIYATRDDALLDLSVAKPTTGSDTQKAETQQSQSPVDYILDPTRRPNAVMLIHGNRIWRDKTNYRDTERGLILASNLPIYIQGDFNKHTQQEFTVDLDPSWSNFYSRTASQRNPNFACRAGDTRLPKCTVGDEWRQASVLSDAITLLSNNFRTGYRNEGDYDLNNNLGNNDSITKFKQNGFSTNAYVPNAAWYGNDGYPQDLDTNTTGFQYSSYLNNFVTPIQRRTKFNEYLMEVCPKLPVSECQPDQWYVFLDLTTPTNNKHSWEIKTDGTENVSTLNSGTTAQPAASDYQRYPRRVAFKRDNNGALVLDANNLPTILGIRGDLNVAEYPLKSGQTRLTNNALWFQTNNSNNSPIDSGNPGPLKLSSDTLSATPESQPYLQPVLQIKSPLGDTSGNTPNNQDRIGPNGNKNDHQKWLQTATSTTFNLAAAGGDTPARPNEDNGGLHNFVRFLENWNPEGGASSAYPAIINGSFIQIKRSAYATGPYKGFLSARPYPINANDQQTSFYIAPQRQWGYDVGLLSQTPDLFAQKLVQPPDDLPNEFFREVGRDDTWVQTLLCAKKADDNTYAITQDQRPACP